jgi:hypothetical protein
MDQTHDKSLALAILGYMERLGLISSTVLYDVATYIPTGILLFRR